MYLHQGLVDNLVLLKFHNKKNNCECESTYHEKDYCNDNIINTTTKRSKLISNFTYKIVSNTIEIPVNWGIYKTQPNTITKLQYQCNHNYIYLGAICDWDYLTGPYINENTMNNASYHGYIYIFEMCLIYGIKPDITTMNRAVVNHNIEIVKMCISFGIKPDRETFYDAIENLNECYSIDDKVKIEILELIIAAYRQTQIK